jgi:Raf kinase inhibitor-like YbhB/YbcL family protein
MNAHLHSAGSVLLLVVLCAIAAWDWNTGGKIMALNLKSSAFSEGGDIPRKFTCDGPDVSPELTWDEGPSGTQSFCIIMDDPDAPAGTWVHWVYYDIPNTSRGLPEGIPKIGEVKDGGKHGRNDFGRLGYGGPCPPRGPAHRYFFKLYALNTRLDLQPGARKSDVEKAMKGHILAQTQLMGRYKR